jgi:hemolysin-activating ACP:hemolysin acyltransferase
MASASATVTDSRPTLADACFGTDPMNAVWPLVSRSVVHKRWAVSEVDRLFRPPLELGTYKLYWTLDGRPVGVITWMMAPLSMIEQLVQGTIRLERRHWTAVDNWGAYQTLHLLFVDLIAPYGHCQIIINDMRMRFHGWNGFALRRNHGKRRLAKFRGYDDVAIHAA